MSAGDLPPDSGWRKKKTTKPTKVYLFHFIRIMKMPDQSYPSQLNAKANVHNQSPVSHFESDWALSFPFIYKEIKPRCQ
jgi:hypothetical protein